MFVDKHHAVRTATSVHCLCRPSWTDEWARRFKDNILALPHHLPLHRQLFPQHHTLPYSGLFSLDKIEAGAAAHRHFLLLLYICTCMHVWADLDAHHAVLLVALSLILFQNLTFGSASMHCLAATCSLFCWLCCRAACAEAMPYWLWAYAALLVTSTVVRGTAL